MEANPSLLASSPYRYSKLIVRAGPDADQRSRDPVSAMPAAGSYRGWRSALPRRARAAVSQPTQPRVVDLPGFERDAQLTERPAETVASDQRNALVALQVGDPVQ